MQKIKIINSKGEEVLISRSKPYLLGSIENIANNSTNIYSSMSSGQDGISIDNLSLKERLIPITSLIFGESKEDLHRKRAFLSSFFNPHCEHSVKVLCSLQPVKGNKTSVNWLIPIMPLCFRAYRK